MCSSKKFLPCICVGFSNQVHCQQPENTDLLVYHTELLAPVAPAAYLKRLFSSLDAELNKVNTFYKTKEEFLECVVAPRQANVCSHQSEEFIKT